MSRAATDQSISCWPTEGRSAVTAPRRCVVALAAALLAAAAISPGAAGQTAEPGGTSPGLAPSQPPSPANLSAPSPPPPKPELPLPKAEPASPAPPPPPSPPAASAEPARPVPAPAAPPPSNAAPAQPVPTPLSKTAAPGVTPALAVPAPSVSLAPNAQPPQSKEEPKPQPSPAPPKNLEPLEPDDAAAILGKKVWGPNGKDLGLVVDVVVDADGHPLAAVIDFGGFLGVGSRRIAIDWRLLHFAPNDKDRQVTLGLDRADIQAAPVFKPDAPSQMVGPLPDASAPADADK